MPNLGSITIFLSPKGFESLPICTLNRSSVFSPSIAPPHGRSEKCQEPLNKISTVDQHITQTRPSYNHGALGKHQYI